jgi:gliding motility-associated protein GldM
MAGGKETPRQKMIGMMYLVLTALLALNVSKTILDAFVAIEENIQVANENEYVRGDEKYQALKEVSEDPTQKDVQKKALHYLKTVNEIDKITAQRIKLIDDLKLEILTAIGEDVTSVGTPESIIVQAYSDKDPLRPAKMNLMHVNGKDKYDDPMFIMIGQDIKNPTGKGMDLWKNYNAYRKDLTEIVGRSWLQEPGEKKYYFKSPEINAFKDYKDLNAQIDKSIAASNVHPDDKEAIKKIYGGLTKKERWNVNDVKGVHWIGKTFDHAPAVAAIASLTSLQKEVLTARADAIALIRGRVGGGEYSFNKIMALAYGPELVNQGDEFEVQVLMAAYDSDRQPEVTIQNGAVNEVKNGKGVIRMKGSGTEMTLKGTITIKNKSGIPKTEEWSKTVRVMKPQGTVSLPHLNVLYIGYENEVEAVASGYDETVLTGVGVDLQKKDGRYIAAPHKVRQASLTVWGKSNVNGKKVQLGTYNFRVLRMPDPEIYWGMARNGERASNRERNLFAKYPPEVPLNAGFDVRSWEMVINGAPGAPPTGTGSVLNDQAMSLLRQTRPGTSVTFYLKVMGKDKVERTKTASFKV